MDAIFYRNQSGTLAISVDGGASVVVPTGRVMAPTEAWEETEDDIDLQELTDAARDRVLALAEEQVRLDAVLAERRAEEARKAAARAAWDNSQAGRRAAAIERSMYRDMAAILRTLKTLIHAR